jgi:hypothetical protein
MDFMVEFKKETMKVDGKMSRDHDWDTNKRYTMQYQ